MEHKKYIRHSFILSLLIILLLGLISQQFYVRLDLSRDKKFSISSYSKDILSRLPDQVDISYYLSPRLESQVPGVNEITDLLYEYQRLAMGRIQVNIVNPDALEEKDQPAPEELGVSPRELQIVENTRQTYVQVYSGIVIRFQDSMEVIPLTLSSAGLEYELTSRIASLIENTTPRVSVLLGHENADPQQYRTMLQYLGQYYDIQVFTPGDPVPLSSDALMVLGFDGLNAGDVYGIEQLILSGKGVAIAGEAGVVDLNQNLSSRNVGEHPVLEMLSSYGLTIQPGWVLDSSNLVLPVQRQEGQVVVNQYDPYPQWVRINASGANSTHPLTSRFQGLDLFWASPISIDPQLQKDEAVSILSSSPDSAFVRDLNTDPAKSADLMLSAADQSGNYPLAVLRRGSVHAYFSRLPESLTSAGINYPDSRLTANNIKLLVIGDSDFPSELYEISGSSYNILFTQNIFQYLLGDEGLLELRTRGERNMRLDALENELMADRVLALARFSGIIFLPSIVAFYGLFRFLRRRKRALQRVLPENTGSNVQESPGETQ